MDESAQHVRDARVVWWTYGVAALLLVCCWEPIVLGRIATARYHNYDLGIYGQAIYRLSPHDPNPWLTVRETKIFNDHFDPILWVAAPLAKVIEPALAGVLVELLFVLASPLCVVWLWKRGLADADLAAVAIVYLLHGRGTVLAILFPFHPTTWAILPMTALCVSMLADRRRAVIASLIALFACKQEFPLVGLMAGLVYLWRREFRFALVVGGLSALWLAAAIYLRPLLLGNVSDYVATRLIAPEGVWATLVRGLRSMDWRGLSHLLVPLLPLAGWLAWRRERPPVWLWLLLVPPVALRFLGRGWGYHYIAPLAPPLVLGLIPLGANKRPPGVVVVAVIGLVIAINAAFWLRAAGSLVDEESPTAFWNSSRLEAIARGNDYLKTHPGGKALVEGNLVPLLVARPDVYQLGGPHDPAAHTFRYVFAEKPPRGDPWPIMMGDCQQLLAEWRAASDVHVIIDDDHVFLAEGDFRDWPQR